MDENVIASIVMIAIGLAMTIAMHFVRKAITRDCTEPIDAVFTERYNHYSYSSNKAHSYPVLEFDYKGQHYKLRGHTTNFRNKLGSNIRIHINPDNPERHYRRMDLFVPGFLTAWGVLVTISGIVVLIYNL